MPACPACNDPDRPISITTIARLLDRSRQHTETYYCADCKHEWAVENWPLGSAFSLADGSHVPI